MGKNKAYKPLDKIIGDTHDREPLSTRVFSSTKEFLEQEALKRGLTVSKLAAAILDDYARNFQSQGRIHESKRS